MKQKIAIDFDIIEGLMKSCCSSDGLDIESISRMFLFHKMIKEYHLVLTDTCARSDTSVWEERCRRLSKELCQVPDDIKKYFDDFYRRSGQEFVRHNTNCEDNLVFEELAQATPDRILVKELNRYCKTASKELNFYNIDSFICNDNFTPSCVLLRDQKIISLKPGYLLKNLNFIIPYVRDAEQIDFSDKYLFQDSSRNDINFLLDIVRKCEGVKSIYCHYAIPRIDTHYNVFLKEIKETGRDIRVYNLQYKNSRNENHDRFIIANRNEYSIRFSTSFNNFLYKEPGQYIVNKAMQITFKKGRDYVD